jgi:hypothetical protein
VLFFSTEPHAMKAYWGSGDIALCILDFGIDWSASRPGRFSPGKETLVPLG